MGKNISSPGRMQYLFQFFGVANPSVMLFTCSASTPSLIEGFLSPF